MALIPRGIPTIPLSWVVKALKAELFMLEWVLRAGLSDDA